MSSKNYIAGEENDVDDSSSIIYIPYQLDYMRDIFRPKLFVKAKEDADESKRTTDNTTYLNNANRYTSIYNGLVDVSGSSLNTVSKSISKSSKYENQLSDKYFARIKEIEARCRHDEKNIQNTEIIDGKMDINFCVTHCDCSECSPRICGDNSLFCELCHLSLGNDTWIHHTQSISHQFKRKSGVHVYVNSHMKPSSKAFCLMSSMGWVEGKGLGINGSGRLEPIPTRLKSNRSGVGINDENPLRITHTPENGDADPNESSEVIKERNRLIHKYGLKRLQKIIKKYNQKKEEMEMKKKDQWLRDEFKQ